MLNDVEEIKDDEPVFSLTGRTPKNIKKLFKRCGGVLVVSGITVLIIGLTGGMATIPIVIGGYLTVCGTFNIIVKV